jgi:2-oxoglutarate ferredoxin oxidoreductase subunit delta
MPRGKVEILLEYCKGCGLCVAVCPTGALAISSELSPLGVNPARAVEGVECRLCRNCTAMCPDAAIRLIRLDEEGS